MVAPGPSTDPIAPQPAQPQLPSSATFSFKAPFPASSTPASPLKQRRVSLALPSSPRLVPAWSFRDDTSLDSHVAETVTSQSLLPEKRGKMRKIADDVDAASSFQEKKQRKKWSLGETQMLVDGCNRHGVGNWKTILSDPNLKFDNRSPVDLKDRFRTYFPDAYKQHYPNARTHLSSKVRSTLPDGSSLFEKTRSKKRRPFTEEEDRALKAGYEKHGTVWATIVKDPVFQEQNRKSTDLRDRFRNAFPELYQAAGYKPRNASRKKQLSDGTKLPVRAATDDQLAMSTTGPVRSRRRAHTSQGLLRGGTKSVPQSTACSEDEDSSAGEEENDAMFKPPQTPVFVDNVSTSSSRKPSATFSTDPFVDDEMEMVTLDSLNDPLFMQPHSELDAQSQTWSSGVDTPVHSHAWSTAAGSPTSSHLSSDYLMNSSHSPTLQRRNDLGMIGKSAWGTQDWFSANPRLDPGGSSLDGGLSPASPFSFHNLNHGVMDRYDLLPTSLPHDFSSEVGPGDSHSTYSDDMFPPSGFRGFTHHSNYAGDLIFGARTHQPQQSYYGSGFGFGAAGLGLSGIPQSTGIHPMQLHTSALPGIDEIELTGITLNDQADPPTHNAMDDSVTSPLDLDLEQHKDEPQESSSMSERFNLDDLVDLSHELHTTPPGTPVISHRSTRASGSNLHPHHHPNHHHYAATHGRSISVPPSEARSGPPSRPPAQIHSGSQPEIATSPFFTSVAQQDAQGASSDANNESTSLPASVSALPPSSSYPSHLFVSSAPSSWAPDAWRSSSVGDLSDLPFLDLHYYSHSASGGVDPLGGMGGSIFDGGTASNEFGTPHSRQGQALDLAQSAASASSSLKSLGIPASLRQHIPPMSPANGAGASGGKEPTITGARAHSNHHRGQSAVCPQDLLLRNDNKRKRSSWDGHV